MQIVSIDILGYEGWDSSEQVLGFVKTLFLRTVSSLLHLFILQ